jgi:hypothetical protein
MSSGELSWRNEIEACSMRSAITEACHPAQLASTFSSRASPNSLLLAASVDDPVREQDHRIAWMQVDIVVE